MRSFCASHRWNFAFFVGLALFGSSLTVRAEIYTYRDASGVYHFASSRRPGWQLFDRGGAAKGGPRREYDAIIRECAGTHDVEPALVKAVIRAESGFDPHAVSRAGARGLMQLLPRTARSHGATNLHDPRQNIEAGVRHLRMLLDKYENDPKLALAAYNAGAGAVARYKGLPPYRETRSYVAKVLRFLKEYRQLERRTSGAGSESIVDSL